MHRPARPAVLAALLVSALSVAPVLFAQTHPPSQSLLSDLAQGRASPQPQAAHEPGRHGPRIVTAPRDLEMRLAVDALPKSLRDTATILVLESSGYAIARQGTNPFTCLVSRRAGNFYPVCFDEEGTRTIMPAYTDDVRLRQRGANSDEVERTLAKGFEEGRYRPPTRAGVAYMLSPATYLLENGVLTRSVPHTMVYAPFVTNSDIAGVPGRTAFVDRSGPHGMVILLAGEQEQVALLRESQALVSEVEQLLALK